MAFKQVIIRRVGPLSWLLEPMINLLILATALSTGADLSIPGSECITSGPTSMECEILDKENARAETNLNATYRKLVAKYDALSKSSGNVYFIDAKKSLIRSQRAWVQYRQEDCLSRSNHFRGLDFSNQANNTCYIEHARYRTKQLQDMINDFRD